MSLRAEPETQCRAKISFLHIQQASEPCVVGWRKQTKPLFPARSAFVLALKRALKARPQKKAACENPTKRLSARSCSDLVFTFGPWKGFAAAAHKSRELQRRKQRPVKECGEKALSGKPRHTKSWKRLCN